MAQFKDLTALATAASALDSITDAAALATAQNAFEASVMDTLKDGKFKQNEVFYYLQDDMIKRIVELGNRKASGFMKSDDLLAAKINSIPSTQVSLYAAKDSLKSELLVMTKSGTGKGGGWSMVKTYNNEGCGGILNFARDVQDKEGSVVVGTTVILDRDLWIDGTRKELVKTKANSAGLEVVYTGAYKYLKGTKYATGLKADANEQFTKDLIEHAEKVESIKRDKELEALTSKAADTMDGSASVGIAVFGEMD